jgi:hypothetical protein
MYFYRMKNCILILIFTACATFANAQQFNAGIVAGIAGTQVEGDGLGGFHKGGAVAGVWLNLPLKNKNFAFQVEMHYTGKGAKTATNPLFQDSAARGNQGFNYYYLMRLHYIDVPFLLHYYNKAFTYEIGTNIGVLAGARIFDTYGEMQAGAQGSPQDQPFNRLDWTTAIGISYAMSDHWIGSWRLSNSITPIRNYYVNVARRQAFGGLGQYNTVMEFTLRYSFNTLVRKAKNKTVTTPIITN